MSAHAPVIVLAGYLVLLVLIGLLGFRRAQASEDDFYLAGRRQGVLVTSLTLMATMFSSAALLGIPGLVYRDGLAFVPFALNLPLSGAAIYVLGSRIRRVGARLTRRGRTPLLRWGRGRPRSDRRRRGG